MRSPFSNKNKTAYLFWFLRWLLALLLFYVFGDFLEGPPTREVVRSWPFIVACVSLPVLTAQFLYQVFRVHFAALVVPALAIPSGYIHFAQLYYDGGKNEPYELSVTLFFVLMLLIGVVYLFSLYMIRPQQPKEETDDSESESDAGYEITLYELKSEGKRGAVKHQEEGGEELPEGISIDGFSRTLFIDLNEYWDDMLENELDDYSAKVTTYETIVKFGETKQLVDNYQIVLKLT